MNLLDLFDQVKAEAEKMDTQIDGSEYIEKALDFFKSLGSEQIFEENAKSLKIKQPYVSSYEKSKTREADGSYNGLTNTINIYNINTIYHELAHAASYKDPTHEGVLLPTDNYEFIVGKSFNEGFCDHIASQLDKDYQLRYPLEKLVVEKVMEKFGDEPLKYFLTADFESFYSFVNKNNLNQLLSNLDNVTNLYNSARNNNKDLEVFYNSYHNLFDYSLKGICSDEEILELENKFISTPAGASIDTLLYKQDVINAKKKK